MIWEKYFLTKSKVSVERTSVCNVIEKLEKYEYTVNNLLVHLPLTFVVIVIFSISASRL